MTSQATTPPWQEADGAGSQGSALARCPSMHSLAACSHTYRCLTSQLWYLTQGRSAWVAGMLMAHLANGSRRDQDYLVNSMAQAARSQAAGRAVSAPRAQGQARWQSPDRRWARGGFGCMPAANSVSSVQRCGSLVEALAAA